MPKHPSVKPYAWNLLLVLYFLAGLIEGPKMDAQASGQITNIVSYTIVYMVGGPGFARVLPIENPLSYTLYRLNFSRDFVMLVMKANSQN